MAKMNRNQICYRLRDLVNARGANEVTLVLDDQAALQLATELEMALYYTNDEARRIVAKSLTGRVVGDG